MTATTNNTHTAIQQLREAARALRVELSTAPLEWPALVIPVPTLAAVTARIEYALELLQEDVQQRRPLPFRRGQLRAQRRTI